MDNSSQTHSGSGDNVRGDKKVYIIPIGLDVGRLTEILECNGEKLNDMLEHIDITHTLQDGDIDDHVIPIFEKNKKNQLISFYNEFIKIHESKLHAIDNYFKQNDFVEKIEGAALNLRIFIFSKDNRDSHILLPSIFNEIIQAHTHTISDSEDKDLMTLLLYYLYRYCYIGDKDESQISQNA